MAFDVAGARAAGYSDEEIAAYLGEQNKFDAGAAMEAGYKPAEIIDHLTVTKPAGGGRGFVNPPVATDVQGNRMREMQDATLTERQKSALASDWTQAEIKRLREINPGATLDQLVALANIEYDQAKTATPATPTDRVEQYVKKGMAIDDARANAEFDEGVQRRLNRNAQEAAPDERGDRVSIGYNPNTEAERVAAQAKELADARQSIIDRGIAEDMNPIVRGLTKGGFQSVGLTGGTVGFIGDAFGQDAIKQWGLDVYDKNMKIANALTLSKGATDISSVEDFQTWLAENSGYVAYQAAEAILSGGLGSAVGKQVGKKAVVEAVGLGLNNLRQTLGSVYGDAVTEAKLTGKEPPSLLQIAGGAVMSAAVDTVADKLGLDALATAGFKGNILSRLGKSVGSQMAVQGGTEAAQLVPEEWGAGRDPFREGMAKQYLDEAAVGALGGTGPGVIGAMQRYQAPVIPSPTPTAPRVEEMPTVPVAPTVNPAAETEAPGAPAAPAASAVQAAPEAVKAVENIAAILGQPTNVADVTEAILAAEAAQVDQGTASAPAAPEVQPAADSVVAAAPATDAVQPAAVPAGDQAAAPTVAPSATVEQADAMSPAAQELQQRMAGAQQTTPAPATPLAPVTTLSPAAQALQQRIASVQNQANGTTDTGTTSTGVAGQPQTPAGVSSVATVQPPVDTGVGQTVGGQPLLTSRATAVGSPAPAGTTRQLAPTAPDALIAQVSQKLKADRGVEFTPYKGPLTTGQQVASAFANANGRTFTVVDRKAGDPLQMPNGFAIPGTNHVVVDRNATDAPLLVAVHEVYHLLPTKLRLKANKALRSLFKENLASEFGREFNVTPDQFEEEIPAYMAQAVSSRPTFWQELRTKMGNKDFSEFASFVLQKFKDLMRGAEAQLGEGFLQKYIGEESKILQAQQILADVYAESMREQGLQPDASVMQTPMMSQKRTQNTERIGELDVTPAKDGSLFVHGDPEVIRAKMPEGVKGRVEAGGVRFTTSDAPRVRGALSGSTTAYSRAGMVNEKLPMKDGKYVGAPKKFDTPGKIPTLRKWLRTLAEEGAPGRFWYENSSRAILQMTGGDVQEARKFVALLAIYSPQAKVDANSTFALRAWAQYKMGQPISVKTRVMDSKAQRAMDNVDELWSGEKTGNFFTNLLSEIDPSLQGKQGATIDMWMMRAGQYDNDAPSKTQYAFMENETNRLARELGWDPHQVQAAIWVAMKARMENAGVKKRTEAISEKKGWIRFDYPLKNGKPKKTRVILNAQAHRDNWLAQSFAHDPTKQDTATAKFDFSDGVRRHIGQVSWEARPGRSTGVLPGVNDAPYDQQVEFQQAVQRALLGPNGEDLLAQQLGLLVDGEDLLAPGVWQGEIAAGMQKQIAMAPAKGDGGKSSLDDTQKQALDTYAAVLGLLLRQEGVGWHRPFYGSSLAKANGVELRIGNAFTPEQARELWTGLDAKFKEAGAQDWENDAGIISSPQGIRVVNFGALEDNKAFQQLVESVANGLSFEADFGVFTSDGNLVSNNWKEQPNGDSYKSRVIAAGRSDLLGWAGSVLAPRVQQVFDEFSQRYDWGDPGSISFSNKPGDGLGGVYGESGPGARPHAVRIDGTHFSSGQRTSLDGRYFGRGLKGAEQTRLAQATDPRIKERVYFYVNEGKGITPEAGVGGYAHAATVGNLYNVQGDPLKLFKASDLNGSESRVLDAGYSGYYFPNYVNGQGIAIVLGNASRGIKVEPAEFQRAQRTQEAPAGPYKYGLTGKELNAIDMPAVQAVAPSAKLRMGTFQVDEAELAAAREELAKQGIGLPDRGPVFSNKTMPQGLDQDITLDIPVEGGRTARLTINAQVYINQLDAREDALRMVKECMA